MRQSSFADSFADFADCQAEYLSEQIESLQGPCRGTMPNSEQANARHCEKLQRIIHAWSALRSRAMLEATEQDLHYQRLLELGFQKFSDRFLKRQEIIESGILVQRIKLALSKMQAVRHLKIRDEDEKRLELFQRATQVSSDAAVVDDEQLLRGMSRWQPMQSADVVAHYEEFPPGAPILIPALLAELDTVISRRLVSLDIGISTGRSLEELSATDTVYSKIQASMQNLKSFRFNHRGPIFPRILDELETLRDFLGSFIVVESLESLAIETNLWKEADSLTAYDPVVLPSTSLIKARTAWPNLSSVLLNTLLIEHSDLTHLLSCVNSTRGCVVLQNIHLLDGSWATILDLLRERHSWAYLASPSGAECEAMSVEEYKRIFGPYNPIDNRTQDEEVTSEPKEAQAYIRGWQDKNPLNIPPELIQSS